MHGNDLHAQWGCAWQSVLLAAVSRAQVDRPSLPCSLEEDRLLELVLAEHWGAPDM